MAKACAILVTYQDQKKNGSDKGLWLLGSDHPNLVLVNNNGRFRAIYEKAGPTTTLLSLPRQRLLLCNTQGRLMLMCGERPKKATSFDPDVRDPKLLSNFYPRRIEEPISSNILKETLREQINNNALKRDFLVMQGWFQSALVCLQEQSDWLNHSNNPFKDYLLEQPVQRIGLFLSDLRHLDGEKEFPGLIDLLNSIWHSLPIREPDDVLIPQLIHHLLRTLEQQCSTQLNGLEAQKLFKTINEFLWQSVDSLDSISDTPNSLRLRISHLRDLRLSQVVYYWQKTKYEKQVARRLDQWCRLLHDAWGLQDEILLKRRLCWVLVDAGLPLVSGDDRQWTNWLQDIFAEKPVKKSGEDNQMPEPLLPLLKNLYSPWTIEQRNRLIELWKMERNDYWGDWVITTSETLNDLKIARARSQRVLWQERRLINKIRGLFRDQGMLWFSFNNGYHLLALCWYKLIEDWELEGKKQIDNLQDEAVKHPSQYVNLTLTKVHWHTGNHAVLTLGFSNWHLEGLRPEPNGISIPDCTINKNDSEMPGQFDESNEPIPLSIDVHIQKNAGVLRGSLLLNLQSAYNENSFECQLDLNEKRSVEAFNDHSEFQDTWILLQKILTEPANNSQPTFLWWDGNHWSGDERKRLIKLIQETFSIDVTCQRAGTEIFEQPLEHLLFSPDIARGEVREGALLEQVHGVLHGSEVSDFNKAALSIWLLYRKTIPSSIINALSEWMYPREKLDGILQAVLGSDHFQQFRTALNTLNKRAIGAWCYGQPLYADNASEIANVALNERYVAAESLFHLDIWSALHSAKIKDSEIASWLGIDSKKAGELLRVGIALSQIQKNKNYTSLETVATLFGTVLEGILSVSSTTQRVYLVEFSDENRISVLHGKRYLRCYLFFADGLNLNEIAAISENHEQGLWLNVFSGHAPGGLPGESLGLSVQQLCGVLFAGVGQSARNALNQLAAQQKQYDHRSVFRTAGGQTAEQTERHFSGREKELRGLHAMLGEADQGKPSARLIIGTRRLGKTSLWDRFRYEVKTEQPNRTFIYLDLHDFVVGEKWTAVNIEREFIARLYKAAGWSGFQTDWPTSLRDDAQKANDIRRMLKSRLGKNLKKPVLILDETRNWAEIDYKINYRILTMLRSLSDGGGCVLIATSYPFHPTQGWGLNLVNYNATQGMYNYFQDDINLLAWEKSTAWQYLQDKLAGFGIVLPYHYRREMWALTRGIPWIVHKLGGLLCDHKKSDVQTQRSVVLRSEWQAAYRKTLAEINAELRGTVTAVVEDLLKSSHSQAPQNFTKLEHESVWKALSSLTQQPDEGVLSDRWEDEQSFSFDDFAENLQNADESELSMVLNALTATPVLYASPVVNDEKHLYYFANNLFPYCLFLTSQLTMASIEEERM